MLPLFRQGTRKRKWGTTHGRDKNRISRMNGSPSAACAGNSSRTLKSLNEVKKKKWYYFILFFFLSLSLIGQQGQIYIREALERIHLSLTEMNQFPCWSGLEQQWRRLPSLSLGRCVQQHGGSDGKSMHVECCRERQWELVAERRVSVGVPDEKNCW